MPSFIIFTKYPESHPMQKIPILIIHNVHMKKPTGILYFSTNAMTVRKQYPFLLKTVKRAKSKKNHNQNNHQVSEFKTLSTCVYFMYQ